jgi:hypothetical protein
MNIKFYCTKISGFDFFHYDKRFNHAPIVGDYINIEDCLDEENLLNLESVLNDNYLLSKAKVISRTWSIENDISILLVELFFLYRTSEVYVTTN